jgi:glycosyltransferase involved in cell wall biosynthesis
MSHIILSVVIPVFNEEKTIGRVLEDHLRELQSAAGLKGWEIVCVDDTSTDGSFAIMERMARAESRIRLFRHQVNQGIAASFGRLFRESKGTHIYVTAGDDQWPATNLNVLLERLRETSADLVIGVRHNRQKVYTPWRRLLSFTFNAIPKLLYKVDTQDANGIKLGRREIFVMPLASSSFFAEVERIVTAQRQGYKITHAPIAFKERPSGKARGASWRNIWMTLCDLVKFIVRPHERSNQVHSA